ncbi:MAG TPA: pseudouridine synthase [Kofleriaceae bacterium]|nr:pseudouridine synthase [Kofleriaceae bacterium]
MILYRDEALVAVAKPSGLLVHRGWGRDRDVLMTRVRDQLEAYVYPVHRLDRGASGVVLFALGPESARVLCGAFERGEVEKRYLALVRGVPPEAGVIDHPVPRAPGEARVPAVTEYRRLEVFGRYALVEARPRTGRFHQIRRHLKHLSCPLIGDSNYGKSEHNRLLRERYGLARLALHAASLAFAHPVDGRPMSIEAPVPADLAEPLARLRADYPLSDR